MAAVRDVSRQREATATAARLASIIQSSHDAVIGESLDRVITSWNPGAERLYGYSAAEMIGRPIEVLIPVARRAAEQDIQDTISRGDRVETYQTERLRKDGSLIGVSIMLSPITDASGTITGVSRVSRDISAQQRADGRFRGLLEAAPDAMVCVAADGRIALVNAQTERLFGYRRDELIGQLVDILVPDAVQAGIPRTGPRIWPTRGPGKWARGWNCPDAVATAARSRRKSPCPPSTPTRASWCRPRSATSATGWNSSRARAAEDPDRAGPAGAPAAPVAAAGKPGPAGWRGGA